MIELTENLLEIAVLSFCFAVSLNRTLRAPQRERILLTFFYAGMLLGNLYWTLYLFFYQRTPPVFYVSELSWCAAFLFLILLLRHFQTDAERSVRSPILWGILVFITAMMLFYFRWGDYLLNVAEAILMGFLMVRSVQGLLALRGIKDTRKTLYLVSLVFCVIEYCVWTASCFWMGDTFRNPYFWFGVAQMVNIAFFVPAVRKAEKR